jgi:UDP-N-acetylmuramoylalanine--D-glutamate ligase
MSFSVANRHVVVVGGGRSGRAAAELLVTRGARVTLTETGAGAIDHEERLRRMGVDIEHGPHRPALLASADLVVLSPGVPPTQGAIAEARARGVPIIGEIELASRWLAGRVIAITGTKGKSTTTTLTARMLQEGGFAVTAGGNLGTALSEQVGDSRPDAFHVVEVSSFQLEATDTFHPWVAVLVNLSADHLDRHGSIEAYGDAKARIFRNQTPDDWAVVNADDAASVALARETRARRFDYALDAPIVEGVTVERDQVVERRRGRTRALLPVASVRLPGRHLLSDVLAAAAVGTLAGVEPEAMARAVADFNGLEHALERVADVGGVRFVNDSKATNVLSARRAIESFEQGVVVIMGGRDKGATFADLADAIAARVAAVVAIGEAAPAIEAALGHVAPVQHAGSMREAVRRGFVLAPAGGVVLLAPACASFDMFQDYAARGRAFKDEVGALAREIAAGQDTGTMREG